MTTTQEPTTLCEDCWNHKVAITNFADNADCPWVLGTTEECDYRTEHGTYIVQLWMDGLWFQHETPAMPIAQEVLVRITNAIRRSPEKNYDLEIVS